MSNYKTILQKMNGNGSYTAEIDSACELRELFNTTPEIVETLKKSEGSTDVGAALTRSILIGDADHLLADVKANVTLSATDEVTIGDNCQWKIPADSNQSIVLKKLILGNNASIKVEHTTLSLSVETLERAVGAKSTKVPVGEIAENTFATYDIGIFGAKGMTGNNGTEGTRGAAGTPGGNAECGTPIGGLPATNGGNGSKGGNGGNGEDGADGKPSLIAVLDFQNMGSSVKKLSISTSSGEGGDGGRGGNGGVGGDGGKGGDGTQCGCTGMDAANGGNGGDGGNGGNGGDGGNGVNGQDIFVNIPKSFGIDNVLIEAAVVPAGSKGLGGMSGAAGAGGARGNQGHKYSHDGKDGQHGQNGEMGQDGKGGSEAGQPGNVTVNERY